MSGFPTERLEITDRRAIRGENPQPFSRRHAPQLTICAQDRQWTAQAFEIKNQFGHFFQFAPQPMGRASPGLSV